MSRYDIVLKYLCIWDGNYSIYIEVSFGMNRKKFEFLGIKISETVNARMAYTHFYYQLRETKTVTCNLFSSYMRHSSIFQPKTTRRITKTALQKKMRLGQTSFIQIIASILRAVKCYFAVLILQHFLKLNYGLMVSPLSR